MKIIHISDRYIFNKKAKPKSTHPYLSYIDKKTKEPRLIGLTHLFRWGYGKKGQVKQGLLKKVHLKEFELPSGVKNGFINSDIDGKPLKITRNPMITKRSARRVPKKIENQILEFGGRRKKK